MKHKDRHKLIAQAQGHMTDAGLILAEMSYRNRRLDRMLARSGNAKRYGLKDVLLWFYDVILFLLEILWAHFGPSLFIAWHTMIYTFVLLILYALFFYGLYLLIFHL